MADVEGTTDEATVLELVGKLAGEGDNAVIEVDVGREVVFEIAEVDEGGKIVDEVPEFNEGRETVGEVAAVVGIGVVVIVEVALVLDAVSELIELPCINEDDATDALFELVVPPS